MTESIEELAARIAAELAARPPVGKTHAGSLALPVPIPAPTPRPTPDKEPRP